MTAPRISPDGASIAPPGGGRPFIATTEAVDGCAGVIAPGDDRAVTYIEIDCEGVAGRMAVLESGARKRQVKADLTAAAPESGASYDTGTSDVVVFALRPAMTPRELVTDLLRAAGRPALVDVRDPVITADELVAAFDIGFAGAIIRTGDAGGDRELAAASLQADAARRASAPRATVVVCNYNGAHYLDRCLQALTDLDHPDYEVILVDDGSSDDSLQRAEAYDVRVLAPGHGGLSVARNAGLQAATGELVAYIDIDTESEPQWLMRCWRALDRLGAEGVGGPNLAFTDDIGWQERVVSGAPGQSTPVVEPDGTAALPTGCNMAFLRESALAVGGFDETFQASSDDLSFAVRMADAGRPLVFAPTANIFHHRRDSIRGFLKQQRGWGASSVGFEDRYGERSHGGGRLVSSRRGLSTLAVSPSMFRGTFEGPHARGLWIPTQAPAQVGLPLKLLLLLLVAIVILLPVAWIAGGLLAWAVASVVALLALFGAVAASVPLHHPAPGVSGFTQRLATAALWFAQPAARRYGALRAKRDV